MSGVIGLVKLSVYLYNEYEAYDNNKKRILSFKESLNKLDINYSNSLIEIAKKEMKELSHTSSLSFSERQHIIEYCKILLNGYYYGYLKEFSKERRDNCNEIIKYCNDPSGYKIIFVFLN